AMRMAIEDSHVDPDAVLIDGNPVHVHPAERCIVKGDSRIACIAAASIVAKVSRDALMVGLDASYPGYHLAESKGYASPEHIAAIRKKGLSELHRATFCEHFVDKSAR
ncbi:MAG: ribonuclease HII, partial [Atopobiaceae bacterium]